MRRSWLPEGPDEDHQSGGLRYRIVGNWLLGQVSLEEGQLDDPDTGEGLAAVTEDAYRAMFAIMRAEGFPHLVRCWNFIPRITDDCVGGQRYFHFNSGRKRAFQAWADGAGARAVPAACAVGHRGREFQACFAASRRPCTALENPRQISAYHYPPAYGPDSPLFSRAVLQALDAGGYVLLISGTASIVGHRSLHARKLAAQLDETVRNLQSIVDQANTTLGSVTFSIEALRMNVYLRHRDDLGKVSAYLAARFPALPAPVFLQADICRRELLVEIEGYGLQRAGDT